jgi:hypothetical protein
VSVSALCGSAREQQAAGGVAPAARMHAVTLDSLRVRDAGAVQCRTKKVRTNKPI